MQLHTGRCCLLGLVALGFVSPLVGCGPINWERSYERGMGKAAQQRRRAVVQFYSSVNKDCQDMDDEVFTKAEVQDVMKDFVAIRLDTVLNRKLTHDFSVQIVPTFVIMRPDWSVATVHAGKMDAEAFRYFLIKNRYN